MKTPDQIDYDARVYVYGLRRASVPGDDARNGSLTLATGEWAPRFRAHPWVIEAEADGWGRELRSYCLFTTRRLMAAGNTAPAIEDVMPKKQYADSLRADAHRYAKAEAWRAKIIAEHGSLDAYLASRRPGGRRGKGPRSIGDVVATMRVDRAAFEARGLTPTSRRMTGEHSE